jgi:hypothetical protein
MAHRTVRCASHVTRSLGFDRWSFCLLGHRTAWWCTKQVLYTVQCAFWLCSDFCAHYSALTSVENDRWRCSSRYSTGTPDSLVNYSGAAPRIPEGEQFGVWFPGAPDSPVRQTRAHFDCLLLFLFEPFLGLFIGLL